MSVEEKLLLSLKTRAHGPIRHEFLSQSVGALVKDAAPPIVEDTVSLSEVLKILKKHRGGAVLITNQAGILNGIFSERDWVLKVASEIDADNTPVSKFMTQNPQFVVPDAPLAYVLSLMSIGGFRHIPIVSDEIILGLLTVKDVLDELVRGMMPE
jgi:CBS domain-containing protein